MEITDKFENKQVIIDVNEKAEIKGFKVYCKAKDLKKCDYL